MTDQDPTQVYRAPEPESAPAGPPAAPAQSAPPAAADAPPTAADAPPAVPLPPAAAPQFAPAEAAPDTVATSPVAAAPKAARPGRSRLKWVVAGVISLLVVFAAVGAASLLTSDSGDPSVLAWTPADSVAYAEFRLDLPGSQGAELAKVMKAIPGFEDQAAFPVKLSEALDQLVGQATDGSQSYKTDIEPWFGGQVGASVGPLPATADAAGARALVLLSVTDATKASAWADGLVASEGGTTATKTYNGVTITTVSPPAGSSGMAADAHGAYAVTGPVLAIGDLASVKAAIDTGGKTGLPTDNQFQDAEASLTGDRLGFAYVDTAAIVKGATNLAGPAAEALPELPAMVQDFVAPWAAASISVRDGAFVVDTRSPHVESAGAPQNAVSKIPSLVPPTTVFLAEGHDVGKTIKQVKDQLAADPSLGDAVKQVDDALALVGGFDAATGWIGEAGIALTVDGDKVGGGVVIVPTDAAAADKLLGQLKALLQLGGAQAGITVTEEPYAGTTITVIGLGGLAGDVSMFDAPVPADLSIAYAVTDDVVVIGYGTDFVKGVLDASTGASLATTERFSTALDKAGKSNSAMFWVDVAGIRGFIEGMVPADARSDYDANAKPYLAAFDSIIGTTVPGETIDSGTVIISVVGS